MPERVPRQHGCTSAKHQRRDAVHGAQEVPRLVGELLGPGTAQAGSAAGGPGEPVEVFALVAVEQ